MEDTNKETLIAKWEEIVIRTKLQLTLNQEVIDLSQQDNIFTVQTNGNSYKGRRVILAPGTRGAPNKIGCPGEDSMHPIAKSPRVMYQLSDGDLYRNKQCTVLGGGDSAIEAALSLVDSGAVVTMAYRRDKFERVKQRNVERFSDYVKQKKIKLYLLTVCKEIKDGAIVLKHERGTFEVKDSSFIAKGKPGEDQLPNDYIFALLGAQAPETFFKKCGIQTHKVPMA
jgi:thioredoxin reductase (NADPH)